MSLSFFYGVTSNAMPYYMQHVFFFCIRSSSLLCSYIGGGGGDGVGDGVASWFGVQTRSS